MTPADIRALADDHTLSEHEWMKKAEAALRTLADVVDAAVDHHGMRSEHCKLCRALDRVMALE